MGEKSFGNIGNNIVDILAKYATNCPEPSNEIVDYLDANIV